MKNKLRACLPVALLCSLLVLCSAITVYAAPEDYIDDIWGDVSSAIDSFTNGEYPTVPDDIIPTEESYTEPSPGEIDVPTVPEEVYTDPPQEQATAIYAPVEDNDDYYDDYDYSYTPPTEPEEDYYEPEVLTETYTDAPFIDRLSLSETGQGNLFVALGVWAAIIVGIIIVISIVVATHNRKKGNS